MPAAVPALIAIGVAAIPTATTWGLIAKVAIAYTVGRLFAPDMGSLGISASDQGLLQNQASNVEPIPVVYGNREMAPSIVFAATTPADATQTLFDWGGMTVESQDQHNRLLHLILVWAEGEVYEIRGVKLDDLPIRDSGEVAHIAPFNNPARWGDVIRRDRHRTGTDGQTYDTELAGYFPGVWTENHRLRGVAYTYLRLRYVPEVFPRGIPNVTGTVAGKLCLDPRDSTTVQSTNPAVALYDYLRNTRYGRGLDVSQLDTASFATAAAYCDQNVTFPNVSGARKRYICTAVLDVDQTPLDNVRILLSAMRGFLVISGGKYKLILDKPEVPVYTFDESNITGGWSITLDSKATRFNRIKCRFFNRQKKWQPDIVVVESTDFRVADNGLVLETEIELRATAEHFRARQIAGEMLHQSRYGAVVEFTATIKGMRAEVGDVVYLTHETPGWTQKLFRVMALELDSADEVRVKLQEYADEVYDIWDGTAEEVPVDTNLPDPRTVAPPSQLTVTPGYDITSNKSIDIYFVITWRPSPTLDVAGYHLQWAEAASNNWSDVILNGWDQIGYRLRNLHRGRNYDLRIRTLSGAVGATSEWVTTTAVADDPYIAPDPPTKLRVSMTAGQTLLEWENPFASDLAGVVVYYAGLSDNLDQAVALTTTLAEAYTHVHGRPAGQTIYYWVAAVDAVNRFSDTVPGGWGRGLGVVTV